MPTGAQIMVKCLEKEGVRVVFGYPGAAICPFYDALTAVPIRHVLVRQEQNAGHAASGYARVTGQAGVCITTSGPGATNLITALATAYMDSVPLVAITGQVSSDLLGRDVFQEVDMTGSSEPFTKHSYLVKDAAELPRIFKEAFYIATTGRPGPVLIDVPVDVQRQAVASFHYPETVDIKGYKPTEYGHVVQIKRVAEALESCRHPLIIAGGGVILSDAREELMGLAEKTGIPVVTTMMGIGVMPSEHPLYLGMLGMHGTPLANHAVQKADLLVIIGARVGDRAVSAPGVLEKQATIVHIDVDPAEIGKNLETTIPLVGNVKLILPELTKIVHKLPIEEFRAELADFREKHPYRYKDYDGYINPKRFMEKLTLALPDYSVVVADVGQNQIWSANHSIIKKGKFLTSGGLGTMGYSLGAALGAKIGVPDEPVVTISGDGSFQMMMMELGTICQNDIDVKIVIMKNDRLGMVCELQKNGYHGNYVAVNLDGSPDFVLLAKAYGIPARSICHNEEIDGAIEEMFRYKGAYILQCIVRPDETSL